MVNEIQNTYSVRSGGTLEAHSFGMEILHLGSGHGCCFNSNTFFFSHARQLLCELPATRCHHLHCKHFHRAWPWCLCSTPPFISFAVAHTVCGKSGVLTASHPGITICISPSNVCIVVTAVGM